MRFWHAKKIIAYKKPRCLVPEDNSGVREQP